MMTEPRCCKARGGPERRLRRFCRERVLLALLLFGPIAGWMPPPAGAADSLELGGHVKVRGGLSCPDHDAVAGVGGTAPQYDGFVETRVKATHYPADWVRLEAHYEMVATGGDTRRQAQRIVERLPELDPEMAGAGREIEDDTRLMDLTQTLDHERSYRLYHRLDRLNLTLMSEQETLVIGRQAVSWGNGLLFNPMDLVNPFAPTDIEREYKTGDDLVSLLTTRGPAEEIQLLYVPRRAPDTGKLRWQASSLAARARCFFDALELELMAARHYRDTVIGGGATGNLGEAAWRFDATWTFLHDSEPRSGYLSLVANLDYAWTAMDRNWYGYLECYFNGLGFPASGDALEEPVLMERVYRGEVFTMGRAYLAGHLRCEAHPLVNLYLTAIVNLYDGSSILQPRVVWDMTQDLQVTLGANLAGGPAGTEFGGVPIGTGGLTQKNPDTVFVWLSWYY
jgi:hypothetical protein